MPCQLIENDSEGPLSILRRPVKVRFSATVGQEPEIELACVIVPLCTENALRFSAILDEGAPEVRFEKIV
jgi:hypothetical protein